MFRFNLIPRWSAAAARERLRKGNVPRRMRVAGHLDLSDSPWLKYLPRDLEADTINVSNCLYLRGLPDRIKCDALIVQRTNIARLHGNFDVTHQIDASDCRHLNSIGPLEVPTLLLRGCAALEGLPEGLKAHHLDVSRCAKLVDLPERVAASLRTLDVSGCTNLTALPGGLKHLATLSIRGCTKLHSLPDDIQIQDWLDVADSGLERPLRYVQTMWHGTPVPDQVAFYPETITVQQILWEPNLELRRVMLERVGMEWFLEKANAEVLDSDCDPGGSRRLLRISFGHGPEMVYVEVNCPSTGRKYVLQVPPQMATCAHAAAWMAGFNNPAHYRPVLET